MSLSSSLHEGKLIMIVMLLAVAACGSARADSVEASGGGRDSPHRAGSWSLQLGITERFQLSSFSGVGFFCKRHYSENSAIRFGVDYGAGFVLRTRSRTGQASVAKSGSANAAVLFSAQYLWYPVKGGLAKLYMGGGPAAGFGISHSTDGTDPVEGAFPVRHFQRRILCGLSGVLGAEWSATGRISIIAEYGAVASFSYDYRRYRIPSGGASRAKYTFRSREFGLNPSAVRFGLCIYL